MQNLHLKGVFCLRSSRQPKRSYRLFVRLPWADVGPANSHQTLFWSFFNWHPRSRRTKYNGNNNFVIQRFPIFSPNTAVQANDAHACTCLCAPVSLKRSENKRVQLTCALISVLETLPSKRNKRLKRTSQTCLHPCACGETTGGWVAPKSRWGAASRVPTIGIKRLLH